MRNLLGILLLAWAVAFFGSFLAFWLTPGRDFGLGGGWNKASAFMGWQMAATVLALLCLGVRWSTSDPRLRRLAAIPAVAVAILLSVLAVVLFWASVQPSAEPDAGAPPEPVTVPALETDG